MIRVLRLLPFAFLATVALILFGSLYSQKQTTTLVGTELPPLTLTRFLHNDLPKAPMMVNFFASWCAPCVEELPLLEKLSQRYHIPIVGIAWKDKTSALTPWLETYGNPYQTILLDNDGAYGISMGLRGLPETYVVDAGGIIRYHHMGPVTPDTISELRAALKKKGKP